jgi:hypothetical protein
MFNLNVNCIVVKPGLLDESGFSQISLLSLSLTVCGGQTAPHIVNIRNNLLDSFVSTFNLSALKNINHKSFHRHPKITPSSNQSTLWLKLQHKKRWEIKKIYEKGKIKGKYNFFFAIRKFFFIFIIFYAVGIIYSNNNNME